MGEKMNAYRILMGKPEGKRPIGKPICRLANNIKRYLREIGWGGMEWLDLVQYRNQRRSLVNTVLKLLVP
jgi:hypothetical protein